MKIFLNHGNADGTIGSALRHLPVPPKPGLRLASRSWLRMGWRFLQIASAALGFLLLIAMELPFTGPWATALAGGWKQPEGEVLVVLGGPPLDRGLLPLSTAARIESAALAFRTRRFHTIVVTGSGGTTPVAVLMRDSLVVHGVPTEAIMVETEAHSTRENASKVAPIVAKLPGRKVLMTSDFHMFRAVRVFRKSGIDVQPWPVRDASWRSLRDSEAWPAFLDLCEETLKIMYYYIRGWI